MRALRWIVLVLAVAAAGWMLFDGMRALVVGDYVTPASGPYAGQLGPWASLLETLGIDPRATAMKLFFVSYGAAWLGVTVAFARRMPWAWWGMIVFAAASLWYLVIGTVSSVVQIALLLVMRARSAPDVRPVAEA
jgi:hypothetical protein